MKPRVFLLPLLCAALALAPGCAARSAPLAVPEGVAAEIDLTDFSETALYAEVCRMQVYTDEYEGKTVMLRGTFRAFPNPTGDGMLYKCVVQDGTGCCTRDLEFRPAGAPAYPADFPKTDRPILVIGDFTTYSRNGSSYCTLADAQFWY